MPIVLELFKFFIILIGYLVVGIFLGGKVLTFILSKFKIKIKNKKIIYLIPLLVYLLAILGQVGVRYSVAFGFVILLIDLYLIYYLIKRFYRVRTKQGILVSVMWFVAFAITNLILGIILVMLLLILGIPIIPSS